MYKGRSFLGLDVEQALCLLGSAFLRNAKASMRQSIKKGKHAQVVYKNDLLRIFFRVVFFRIFQAKGILSLSDSFWQQNWSTFVAEDRKQKIGPPLLNGICHDEEWFSFLASLHISAEEWKDVDIWQIGALYQRLLEKKPRILGTEFSWKEEKGKSRKSTGAYFTPPSLVKKLLKATLDPLIKGLGEEEILKFRICDPACGTGYFLAESARYLAKKLVSLRGKTGRDAELQALRELIPRVVYGVDLNPLSVELCRLTMCLVQRKRDSFSEISAHICQGDALLGAWPELLSDGIRTDFFTRVVDEDDARVVRSIRSLNRKQRKEVSKESKIASSKYAFDLFLSSMFWPKNREFMDETPTQTVWSRLYLGEKNTKRKKRVSALKKQYHFFHWPKVFPSVFAEGGFNAVVGNPPYLDSEFLTTHQPRQREALCHLYDSTRGNWDIYIPFFELGVRILKKGGRCSLVTPNKILGSDYASSLHKSVFFSNRLKEIHDFSKQSLFKGASVPVVFVVVEKGEREKQQLVLFFSYRDGFQVYQKIQASVRSLEKLPKGYIAFPLASSRPGLLRWYATANQLSSIASCSDGATTEEAYLIRDVLQNGCSSDRDRNSVIKLINTGTVDPFHLQWGEKNIRYLGFKKPCPILEREDLQSISPRRYAQAMREKVIVAGMGSKLEAAVAPVGFLCGKTTVLIQNEDDICPYALCAFLNSDICHSIYKGLFSMRGISGKAMNIGPRQIERLPIPPRRYLKVAENEDVRLSLLGKTLHLNLSDEMRVATQKKLNQFVEEIVLGGKLDG